MIKDIETKKYEKYDKEEEIVLRMSKINASDNDYSYVRKLAENNNIKWDKIIGILILNRLVGVAYKNLNKCIILPIEVERALMAIFEVQEQIVLEQKNQIMIIGTEFERRNLNYCFLKGAVLNSIVYELGERVSNDTDILVDEKELDQFIEALEALGYIQGYIYDGKIVPASKKEKLFARMNTYEIIPFHKQIHNKFMPIHSIDINFKLSNEYSEAKANNLLENSLIIGNSNFMLRTMELEKFILFLCVHLYREAVMAYKIMQGKDLSLYKFMDIHFMLIKYKEQIDINNLYGIAEKICKIKEVFFAFYYTEKLFPGTFGENILEMFQPDDVAYLNQYKSRDNTEVIFTWKEEFEQRVFSDTRVEEARQNIEGEEKRRKSIINMLGNEK